MAKKKETNEIWTDIVTKTNVKNKRISPKEKEKKSSPVFKPKKLNKNTEPANLDLMGLNVPALPPKMKDLAMRLKRKRRKNKGI